MDVHLKHETYLSMLGLATVSIGAYALSRRSQLTFARGVNWSDVVLMGLATHKITRTAARDRVTAPLRAPFTQPFEELDEQANPSHADPTPSDPTPSNPTPSDPTPSDPTPSNPTPSDPTPSDPTQAGGHESAQQSTEQMLHGEHALARTFQHSLGELITCQYCLGPWVALGLHLAYVRQRAVARAVSSVFAVVAISDALNRLHARMEK